MDVVLRMAEMCYFSNASEFQNYPKCPINQVKSCRPKVVGQAHILAAKWSRMATTRSIDNSYDGRVFGQPVKKIGRQLNFVVLQRNPGTKIVLPKTARTCLSSSHQTAVNSAIA